ncbi:hypothetical protein [Pseudomonas sp. GL-B-19]|uniref:hypothetical protein n=1 Tax=Pseudomonas sp. GL-B-19 TaxID=2832393 RepID=UPI001CC1048A|nr:hypothetical protein [Pseudomonas sp. GL-B-19]
MIRSDLSLFIVALLLTLAHLVYSTLERHHLYGPYFSQGIVLFENGESISQNARLQFQKNNVYDFQQIDSTSHITPLGIKSTFRGSFFLTTLSKNQSLNRASKKYAHSQLAYNQAYYAKENMPLTFYRLPTRPDNFCAYIVELQKLRCFGLAH